MNASTAVTDDGSSTVPLRVDRVGEDPTASRATLYCTDIEGTELRVALDVPHAGRQWEAGEWYQFDGVVRSPAPGAALLLPAGEGHVEHIEPPEERADPSAADLDDAWLIQLGASDRTIAVTVQPRSTDGVTDVRAGDPETFEIGAVCLNYYDGTGETTIYHREEPEPRDEHLLLQHVVEDLSDAEGATLVTYGTDRSPLGMLRTRLAAAAGGDVVESGAEGVLEECFHADMESVAARAGADTLVALCRRLGIEAGPVLLDDYDIGIAPADWRSGQELESDTGSDVADPQMSDRDYAALLERYLGTTEAAIAPAELSRCLKAYASADLPLLDALLRDGVADRLACRRLTPGVLGVDQSV